MGLFGYFFNVPFQSLMTYVDAHSTIFFVALSKNMCDLYLYVFVRIFIRYLVYCL